MNDFSELENQLKRLRPVQPSEELIGRVERTLSESSSASTAGVLPRVRRFQLNWSSLGLGLTAVVALLLLVFLNVSRPVKERPRSVSTSPTRAVPSIAANEFVPAGLTRVVYHTRDEGLRFPSGAQQPMRRMRVLTRETMVWRNPATGASIRVSYPSDEVSLTPVSGQ